MQRKQLISLCKSVGVMLLDDGGCLRVDAPVGFRLLGNGMHSHDCYLNCTIPRAVAYDEMAEAIGDGVEKCDDPECDACVVEPCDFDKLQELYGGERLA